LYQVYKNNQRLFKKILEQIENKSRFSHNLDYSRAKPAADARRRSMLLYKCTANGPQQSIHPTHPAISARLNISG
jgi:hypothetical protein